MMSAPPPGDPGALQDSATKRKEDVAGMASNFSSSDRSIPPLVDIPQELVSRVLHGGATPQGGCRGSSAPACCACGGVDDRLGHLRKALDGTG